MDLTITRALGINGMTHGSFKMVEETASAQLKDLPSKDGDYFLQKLADATKRLNELCSEFNPTCIGGNVSLPEESTFQTNSPNSN